MTRRIYVRTTLGHAVTASVPPVRRRCGGGDETTADGESDALTIFHAGSLARGAKVEDMASDAGREILEEKGLQPVSPTVVSKSGEDAVPENVMSLAEATESPGPLEL